MENYKIVFLDKETLSPETVLRTPNFPHEIKVYQSTHESEASERIADAEIVIVNKVPLGKAAIEGAKNLKLIAVAATGYDRIDIESCKARNVTVSNIRDYAKNTVPEHTFALILALRRSIIPYRQSVLDSRWQDAAQFCYFDYPIHDLANATLGVIGDGVLGKSVARLGEAFGMNVLFSSYKGVQGMGPLYTPFEEVLRQSDIITLHCPLIPSTRNLLDQHEFSIMEKRPLIINAARGGLVNEEALGWALEEGLVSGAGFDVVTEEPPARDHLMMTLAKRHNVILTPHVAWASQEAVQSLADQLIDNIEAFYHGEARNVVV